MRIEMFEDYPTQFRVWSRTQEDVVYFVWLTDPRFMVNGQFNGSCDCGHFNLGEGNRPSLRKQLLDPSNTGLKRCAHIRAVREHCFDEHVLPYLAKHDPNIKHDTQASY